VVPLIVIIQVARGVSDDRMSSRVNASALPDQNRIRPIADRRSVLRPSVVGSWLIISSIAARPT